MAIRGHRRRAREAGAAPEALPFTAAFTAPTHKLAPSHLLLAPEEGMCCILCFDDSPVEDGPRYGYGKDWDTNMFEAPAKNCPWFCAGYLCAALSPCPPTQ